MIASDHESQSFKSSKSSSCPCNRPRISPCDPLRVIVPFSTSRARFFSIRLQALFHQFRLRNLAHRNVANPAARRTPARSPSPSTRTPPLPLSESPSEFLHKQPISRRSSKACTAICPLTQPIASYAIASTIIAIPCPPPMHARRHAVASTASPQVPAGASSPAASRSHPADAPVRSLHRSHSSYRDSSPSTFSTARYCAANASFTSIRSICSSVNPASVNAFCDAGTGPIAHDAAAPLLPWPTQQSCPAASIRAPSPFSHASPPPPPRHPQSRSRSQP